MKPGLEGWGPDGLAVEATRGLEGPEPGVCAEWPKAEECGPHPVGREPKAGVPWGSVPGTELWDGVWGDTLRHPSPEQAHVVPPQAHQTLPSPPRI